MILSNRLLIKITKDTLPFVKDRYPFIYLERGRLEIDDSSVKWIDSACNVVRLPVATISTILVGPGTSVTHEAIKVLSQTNTMLCWVGEDGLLFYSTGVSPTSNTRNVRLQASLSSKIKTRTEVARRMFCERFDDVDVTSCTISDLMGKEGKRVKKLYEDMAEKYKVGWQGRSYVPGQFELSDITNKVLTSANTALYALVTSVVFATGFSPYLGFVHTGSPLPFVYDLADLYKEHLCVDFAFSMTKRLAGFYDRHKVLDEFRIRVLEFDLLGRIKPDIDRLFKDLE